VLRSWFMRPTVALTWALQLSGCGASPADAVERQSSAVIYQQDDRVEALQYEDPAFRTLATNVVGAILPRTALTPVDGGYEFTGPSLETRRSLCAGEPLADQLSVAVCTATLAGHDTVLTAGHCVRTDLAELVFVRGYVLGGDFPRVATERVRGLARVLNVRDGDIASESGDDFAIVKLEGSEDVPGITFPAQPQPVSLGDPVVVVGTSEGLPMKIEAGGTVYDVSPQDYFEITSDTFEGGSGSPTFAPDGRFLGILVGGAVDYQWDRDEACFSRAHYDSPEDRGEIIVRADVLRQAWEVGVQNDRSTSDEPTCGMVGVHSSTAWWWGLLAGAALFWRRLDPHAA